MFAPAPTPSSRGFVRLHRAALCLLCLLFAATATAATGTFTLKVNERKADGTSWRGSGAVFFSIPGIPGITPQAEVAGAPSPMMFIVGMDGQWTFVGKDRDPRTGRPISPCHLSHECEFEDVELPEGEVFGVVFATTGILLSGLIDAVIFSRQKMSTKDPAYQEFNAKLHEVVERIVPSNSPGELRRRSRPFQLLTAEDCAVASCTLRQSIVKIETQ